MEVTKVTDVSAFISGEVEPWGGTNITERGIYVSLAPASETSGTKHSIGSGIGEYAQEITGLAADTKYYYRAYAINSAGRGLGQELTFSTAGGSAGCYAARREPSQIVVIIMSTIGLK
jgi:hypothetical protein